MEVEIDVTLCQTCIEMGGRKRQLLSKIDEHLPPEISEGKITTYVEPMVGGAVFFHMKRKSMETKSKSTTFQIITGIFLFFIG